MLICATDIYKLACFKADRLCLVAKATYWEDKSAYGKWGNR